jgi:hypothetical protein
MIAEMTTVKKRNLFEEIREGLEAVVLAAS